MIDGIDPASLTWRKSSYSESGGECVETAVLPDRRVAVRHSKQPGGAILLYTPAEWRAFVAGAKAGEFDLG
jgi:predicted secreted Zn-dependent protease